MSSKPLPLRSRKANIAGPPASAALRPLRHLWIRAERGLRRRRGWSAGFPSQARPERHRGQRPEPGWSQSFPEAPPRSNDRHPVLEPRAASPCRGRRHRTPQLNAASPEAVEGALAEADASGATIGRARQARSGGYTGVSIDPDGHPCSPSPEGAPRGRVALGVSLPIFSSGVVTPVSSLFDVDR